MRFWLYSLSTLSPHNWLLDLECGLALVTVEPFYASFESLVCSFRGFLYFFLQTMKI